MTSVLKQVVSGIGIKPDKLELIWQVFCQADGSTT